MQNVTLATLARRQRGANIAHAVATFGHLVTLGTTLSFDQFAARIRKHSQEARAQELATELTQVSGKIKRGLFGRFSAQWGG